LVNEPDTDWSLPHHAQWAEAVLRSAQHDGETGASEVPLFIGTSDQSGEAESTGTSLDPSRPGVVVCRYRNASPDQLRRAVSLAAEDPSRWRATSAGERHRRLRHAAQRLRQDRGRLIGAMVAEGGKTVLEADPEVSEAIDFVEFYPLTAMDWQSHSGIKATPRGVAAVITPWNFPLAIPCGGIAASLAAGNCVILKPAAETVLTARFLCEAFWNAGIPREALQLLPCRDEIAEQGLVRNAMVDAVILTGGTATARRLLSVRPDLHLLAETGGKNATIVTAMADRDLAIKHIVQSAFGHAGQKCSATSLLLLQDEVYRDESFRRSLADAVASLSVGSAWELHTKVGPLISPPGEKLSRGLKTLEDDESWLVVPEHVVGNPNLYRPGVKWNIRPGGFMHRNELFGPVLGVMPFGRLEEAIEIVHQTGYGLTSGLESLDDREVNLWKENIRAGNLYINRPTTGAIVLRQPFGGVGLSACGPGVKAGGPHYVLPLMHLADPAPRPLDAKPDAEHDSAVGATSRQSVNGGPLRSLVRWLDDARRESLVDRQTAARLTRALGSQQTAFAEEFSQEHDSVKLVGQDNLRRYRPVRALTLRVNSDRERLDALVALAAATAVQTKVTVSMDPRTDDTTKRLLESIADSLPGWVEPLEETDDDLAKRIGDGHVDRLRCLRRADADCPAVIACAASFVTIVDEPVLQEGRIECLRYLDEQSISYDYHRYGNLGRRSEEPRREVK
jgi:RHH-type proline utilization regulon transcriptional repressor/proline dehydrogenase/delta 1-pyrroline-5-carboxylate dehydrogenase